MKCRKMEIPLFSLVQKYLPVNYTDAFSCNLIGDKVVLSADEIMIDFWTVMPRWVNSLFKLRNLLVRPFGLATENREKHNQELKEVIRSGKGCSGLISVLDKTEDEIVVLLSDKHLDAYMSVLVKKNEDTQTVFVITLVRYHNRLGKIYFSLISPFHIAVVKAMLKSTLKRMIK